MPHSPSLTAFPLSATAPPLFSLPQTLFLKLAPSPPLLIILIILTFDAAYGLVGSSAVSASCIPSWTVAEDVHWCKSVLLVDYKGQRR